MIRSYVHFMQKLAIPPPIPLHTNDPQQLRKINNMNNESETRNNKSNFE